MFLHFYDSVTKIAKTSKYNIFYFGVVAFATHVVSWLLLTQINPVNYENVFLRIVGIISAIILIANQNLPISLKRFLPSYWLFAICYNLPFFVTVYLFSSGFSPAWMMLEVMMIFVSMIFISNIFLWIANIFIGVLLAIKYSYLTIDNLAIPDDAQDYAIILALSALAGLIFNHNNLRDVTLTRVMNLFKSASHSLMNEIKESINIIGKAFDDIFEYIPQKTAQDIVINKDDVRKLHQFRDTGFNFIDRSHQIIDINLNNIKTDEFKYEGLEYLSASTVIKKAINKYCYNNEEEKRKIITKFHDNFILRAQEELFIYVLFNIIKNALAHINHNIDNVISIETQTAKEGDKYSKIIIRDRGPGIKTSDIECIFNEFATLNEKRGVGLGLSFCKQVMVNFGGDIECRSIPDKYTEFTLLFPAIVGDELETAKTLTSIEDSSNSRIIKILIVDDQEVNVLITKTLLERNLDNVLCDTAFNGEAAVELAIKNNYDVILMDLYMPILDGVGAAKKIREFDQDTPIITYSSRTSNKARDETMKAGFNDYMIKPISHNLLLKTIAKWALVQYSNPLINDDLESILSGKKILVVDDQELNRFMIAKYLEEYGVNVTKASNGEGMLNEYIKSEESGQQYDVILADIHMPGMDGDEAAKKIKEYHYNKYKEDEDGNLSNNLVPIIAVTGDDGRKDIYRILSWGMNDFFVKGTDYKILIQMVAFWIVVFSKELGKKYQYIKDANNMVVPTKLSLEKCMIINDRLPKHILSQLRPKFLSECRELVDGIKDSYHKDDIKRFIFDSHALKGLCGSLGAEKIFILISRLNMIAKKNTWPEDDGWIESLELMFEEVKMELEEIPVVFEDF